MPLATLFNTCEQLQKDGKTDEALSTYKTWLDESNDPNRYMAWFNYGSLLQSTGNPTAAEDAYRQSLGIQPRFPQALINLGLTLEKLAKRDEALQQWASLVSQRYLQDPPPSNMLTMALNHIGRVQEELKQYVLAEQALEESLAIDPKQTNALQHWIHIRQKSCAWPVYKPLPHISQHEMLMATSPLAMLALTDDPVQQLLTNFAFVERTYGFKQEYLSKGRQYHHERLRIGFVSGDLCVHAVGLLLAEVLEGIDRSKHELVGYDFSPEDGTAHRARLKKAFDHLRPIHTLTDHQVAELVLADEIDVLIDLHGLSSGARPGIFALHPAPKQGTYLGFIGTTGMPWFDFVIADREVLPPDLLPYFSEKPLFLDTSFIPLSRGSTQLRDAKRSEFDLPELAFVMASFGNVYKLTPEIFDCWLSLLREIPRSVLWLIDDNPVTTANLKAYATRKGAELSRILFTPRSTHIEYKAKLKLADVFLDTYPYNCGSTTNDVVSVGTPIVTMFGKTMVSRMGKSILNAVNRGEWISDSIESYKNKVKDIAKLQSEELVALKNKLLEIEPKNSKFFNFIFEPCSQLQQELPNLKLSHHQLKKEQNKLTLITHHYNGHQALQNLVDSIKKWPSSIKNQIQLVAVDDGSETETNLDATGINLKYYRITDDIPWNQAGARNLGCLMAQTEWVMFFDVDQIPNESGINNILTSLDDLSDETLYYFYVEDFVDSNLNTEMKVHPNTLLVNCQRFKETCMYDEDFSGHYGFEDIYLPYVWENQGGKRSLYGHFAFFKDQKFKTAKLDRNTEINHNLAKLKISQGSKKPVNLIRFNWKIIQTMK